MQSNSKASRRLENCQGLNYINSSQSAHSTVLWQCYTRQANTAMECTSDRASHSSSPSLRLRGEHRHQLFPEDHRRHLGQFTLGQVLQAVRELRAENGKIPNPCSVRVRRRVRSCNPCSRKKKSNLKVSFSTEKSIWQNPASFGNKNTQQLGIKGTPSAW